MNTLESGSCLLILSSLRLAAPQVVPKVEFEHNYGMPPLELLNDFNTKRTTTGWDEAPLAWLQPRECAKILFTALPTYVNHQCEIYLSLASDETFIHHMRNLLTNHFKPLLERQRNPSSYVVGQPVVVTYHLDNLFYRGIVKSKMNADGEHKVYYVDYGNEEKVAPADMLPYAPFPQLNAMCWRVAIHGVKPKQKNYTIKTMDSVHQTVVMKLSSVRVVNVRADDIPQCQIKVGDMDIATMMLNNEMAIRTASQADEELKQERAKALKSFKVFDELHQLGDVQTPLVLDQVNTTVQPPPAKKKLMMDSEEIIQTDCEKDFDCKEAAKLDQLDRSVNMEGTERDMDNSEENNSAEAFSDDYIIEEIVEVNSNKNDEKMASQEEQEQASFMPPQNISAVDQLRRRIQLRYKVGLSEVHDSFG